MYDERLADLSLFPRLLCLTLSSHIPGSTTGSLGSCIQCRSSHFEGGTVRGCEGWISSNTTTFRPRQTDRLDSLSGSKRRMLDQSRHFGCGEEYSWTPRKRPQPPLHLVCCLDPRLVCTARLQVREEAEKETNRTRTIQPRGASGQPRLRAESSQGRGLRGGGEGAWECGVSAPSMLQDVQTIGRNDASSILHHKMDAPYPALLVG